MLDRTDRKAEGQARNSPSEQKQHNPFAMTYNGIKIPRMSRYIGEYRVPILYYLYPTLGSFLGGAKGEHEAGDYAFWTVMLKTNRYDHVYARNRVFLGPEERFNRKPYVHDDLIQRGKNVRYIRPSTVEEVKAWLYDHPNDSEYLYRLICCGREIDGQWNEW